jgi:hypothetical protein
LRRGVGSGNCVFVVRVFADPGEPGSRRRSVPEPVAFPDAPADPIEARVAAAAEELRQLHEDGELDWMRLHAGTALQWAFLDEDDDPAADAAA